MTDDRMTDVLRVLAEGGEPNPAFLDRLYGELVVDLGLRAASAPVRLERRRSRRWWLLTAAALTVALAGSTLIAGAAVRLLREGQPTDVLDAIHEAGVLRVVVPDGYPQARSPQGNLGGFDIDVATELASRLGVTTDVSPASVGGLSAGGAWHLAMTARSGSQASDRFVATITIYYWPIHLVVPVDSAVETIAGLDGASICVVEGSRGHAWLTGGFTGSSATPIQRPPGAEAVTRPDDESCLDALADGTVTASVTADLSPADLAVRGGIRVLGSAVLTEERGAIVDRETGDVAALLAEIDEAIEAARADGTLSDLARSRFGGLDLSARPPVTPKEE